MCSLLQIQHFLELVFNYLIQDPNWSAGTTLGGNGGVGVYNPHAHKREQEERVDDSLLKKQKTITGYMAPQSSFTNRQSPPRNQFSRPAPQSNNALYNRQQSTNQTQSPPRASQSGYDNRQSPPRYHAPTNQFSKSSSQFSKYPPQFSKAPPDTPMNSKPIGNSPGFSPSRHQYSPLHRSPLSPSIQSTQSSSNKSHDVNPWEDLVARVEVAKVPVLNKEIVCEARTNMQSWLAGEETLLPEFSIAADYPLADDVFPVVVKGEVYMMRLKECTWALVLHMLIGIHRIKSVELEFPVFCGGKAGLVEGLKNGIIA
jgi:hypothetical protein